MSKEITIEELSDFDGSIDHLIEILMMLGMEYGEYTRIRTDAGHNNVDFKLTVDEK